MAALQQAAANIFGNFLPDDHAMYRHQSDRLSKIFKPMKVVVVCEVPVVLLLVNHYRYFEYKFEFYTHLLLLVNH
jgi:hypothetical protein